MQHGPSASLSWASVLLLYSYQACCAQGINARPEAVAAVAFNHYRSSLCAVGHSKALPAQLAVGQNNPRNGQTCAQQCF